MPVGVQGKDVRVQRAQIDESPEQKTSIMPGVSKSLSRREIQNRVTYPKTPKFTFENRVCFIWYEHREPFELPVVSRFVTVINPN